jgi:hypothetical protein
MSPRDVMGNRAVQNYGEAKTEWNYNTKESVRDLAVVFIYAESCHFPLFYSSILCLLCHNFLLLCYLIGVLLVRDLHVAFKIPYVYD